MSWTILHITDLHLGQVASDRPAGHPLRPAYFKKYISDFVECVPNDVDVDCIVVTGDIVDYHKEAEFFNGKEVIAYLAQEFGLSLKNVVVCPGDHDFVWEKDKLGDEDGARHSYREFAGHFANQDAIAVCGHRGLLCKPAKNIWALSLDATLGCRGEIKPGQPTGEEIDEICGIVDKHVPKEGLLIVASHYPTFLAPDSVPQTTSRFLNKNFWTDNGAALGSRLRKLRKKGCTLFTSGDTHLGSRIRMGSAYYLMTGYFGTAPNDSKLGRQASIVSISQNSQESHVRIMAHMATGHVDNPSEDVWSLNPPASFVPYGDESSYPAVLPAAFKKQRSRRAWVETLNANLESQILTTIATRHLYYLGRFRTAETDTSLSWVAIAPLLNQEGIAVSVIDRMAGWLREQPSFGDPSSSVILGLDYWGAILATQLSVVTGVKNYCFAARTKGETYSLHERLDKKLVGKIKGVRCIALVTDVVVTGSTLRFAFDSITAIEPRLANATWFGLSVICDAKRKALQNCDFLEMQATACGNLTMLVLPNTSLPEEGILPVQLSLSSLSLDDVV